MIVKDKIERLLERGEVEIWTGEKSCKKINQAFRIAQSEDDKMSLLVDLLNLWDRADSDVDKAEAEEFFGHLIDKRENCRLIYTLTADGKQFRIWHSFPARIRSDHVDSCGKGLLFEVVGDEKIVIKYLDAVLNNYSRLNSVSIPNGVTLYLNYEL